MNWYKIAFPLVQRPKDKNYADIGHMFEYKDKQQKVFIWRIDEQYLMHTFEEDIDSEYGRQTHTQLAHMGKLPISYIAQGRYVPAEHTTSMFILPDAFGGWANPNYRRKDYIIKKVEEVLDSKFNTPKIIEFAQ